ncbi:MAG TPA: SGNH/GDSL hydrolase family protein [Chloroflexota bacterium]
MGPQMVRASLAVIATVLFLLAPQARAGHAATAVGAKAYYLALGDSLGFGYQPNFDFSHGYANDLYTHLQPTAKSFTNLGCPGETSGTFINGGCPYWYLRKTFYLGSQLSAALSFIKSHAGQVSPVTLDLGANDMLPLINKSTCAVSSSWQTSLSAFDTNFRLVLSRLKSQLNGTGDLVVMNYYDPFENQCMTANPDVLAKLELFNAAIAQDAAAYNVPVAKVFEAFGGDTTPNANPNICTDTWMCSSYNDIHATTAGYSVIAGAFDSALGY